MAKTKIPVGREGTSLLRREADDIRRDICGPRASYVHNINISVTDRCDVACAFCGFSKRPSDPAAYHLEIPEVLDILSRHRGRGISEVCIQGGISPRFLMGDAMRLLRAVRASFPNIHIHAFSPMEVFHFAGRDARKVRGVLLRLRDCGLGSMPGTAAEILSDDVRRVICPGKIDSSTWRSVIRAAHGIGLRTSATILIGHIETQAHRKLHLKTIKDIQEESGGFTEFVVLPFVPWNTRLRRRCPSMLPKEEILAFIAAARIFLKGCIPNIQASWVKMGLPGAVEALRWGANDLGGTLYREEITRAAGGEGPSGLSEQAMRTAIAAAGRVPARRDTLYTRLEIRPC